MILGLGPRVKSANYQVMKQMTETMEIHKESHHKAQWSWNQTHHRGCRSGDSSDHPPTLENVKVL